MKLLSNEKIIDIMSNTLNHVDARLMDHGERVAYMMYKVLVRQDLFDEAELRDICILAMLHDVGAYKTEEIDNMVLFETKDVWEHSIYGSLFLKYFSPLRELAPVILYHHAECHELGSLKNEQQQILAQLVSLCDRADVFAVHGGKNENLLKYIEKYRDVKYRGDILDMYFAADINIETVFEEMKADDEFNRIFHKTPPTDEDVTEFINMIVYSIDFRSSQTVIHTLATACIAMYLARKLGADEEELVRVETGAMLHDIGKVGIPLHILESTGKLSDDEMAVMRTHINFSEEIIDGMVDEDIKFIAINHHEKLNGTGYPNRLEGQAIAKFDRVVAIADIFSALSGARSYKGEFSKDRVVGILKDMADQNLLDAEIVEIAIINCDEIMEIVREEAIPIIRAYDDMNAEYLQIRESLR